MDKSNMIISVIIVLCIAVGVTAYGLSNPDNAQFSELPGIEGESGESGVDGKGNNTTVNSPNSQGSGSSSDSSNSGRGSSNVNREPSNPSPQPNPSPTMKINSADAKSIVNSLILEEGSYAGEPSLSGSGWYVPIYNLNGEQVDGMFVDGNTGMTSRE